MGRHTLEPVCDECGGRLVREHGEAVCAECGLVNGPWFTSPIPSNERLGSVNMRSFEMKKLRAIAWEIIDNLFKENVSVTSTELVQALKTGLPEEVSTRTIYALIEWFKQNGYIVIHKTVVLEPKVKNVYLRGRLK